ncbi:tetratricopeptide repeat protein [Roseibacillus ishigakijimensis]|uniref:Tetratricopeptide repeat protein n=1 Tax=Roseibacillus ishigakijimensis TaxID=454146 RepID=A0A934RKL0_9BACT|nr:tetratricopeptide repeat protein [Roseibacillus ishigakijimensis]MBK1832568.1 tetratricopeptide repeat protein [Roseibacillus ishigakijimensis]
MKHYSGALLALFLLFVSPTSAPAQGGVQALHSNSLTAMTEARRLGMPEGAAKWNEALGYLVQATDTFDGRAMQLFGPQFGWFWYHRGFCELKLNKFEEAANSFKNCYEKYPNKPDAQSVNTYHIRALLKWGEAAQGQEDYETAIKQFKKFLAERDPQRDNFPKGAFYVNLAICHFKSGKMAGGLENLKIAVQNKNTFPTPPAGIMAGFQAFCEAAIEAKEESTLLEFMDSHRADILFQPWEAQPYSPIFMKLAADALQAEMPRVSFELYALVPSSTEAENSIKAALAGLGEFPGNVPDGATTYNRTALEQQLAQSRERSENGQIPEITALAATAYIHEENGNIRGAYGAYDMLEQFYSRNSGDKRETYLYQLVRTASLVGRVKETEKHGQNFLRLFPGSQYEDSVRSLMLTGLFYAGEYETCIKVASEQIKIVEEGSEQHDICLHVLGGSYYYTGQFDKAQDYLQQHVDSYPESQFKVAAEYFAASNFAQLQLWATAGPLLDKFLKAYPNPKENAYLPYALYDRANTHFAQEEYEPALERLAEVENNFPDAGNREMVFNLKGNILQTQGELEEARSYYERALTLAETKENDVVAGESLFYLVGMLGEEGSETLPEALTYYDQFWAKYGDASPYKAQVAVAGLPALESADRSEEGLSRLEGVISQLAKIPGAYGLEEAINSYTKFFLKDHSEEELKDKYYDFPGIRAEDKAAQALLRIAIIGVYEEKARTALKENASSEASKANAMIKVLFTDLKQDFDLPTLSNYILVSVGDYLREKTASPREAIPYYEEVLGRNDQSYRFNARFGLADVFGRSDSSSDNEKAVQQLLAVYENSTDDKQKQQALYRAVEVLAKLEQWEQAKEKAKAFLAPELNFNTYASNVAYVLAQAYDNLGQQEEALITYFQVYSSYRGQIAVSAPSLKRYMELLWNRNKAATDKNPADRQFAYRVGHEFITATASIPTNDRVPEEEKELWNEVRELVLTYEAHSDTKPIVADENQ